MFRVFTPTRLLHGTINTSVHMQHGISKILEPVEAKLENYMNEISPHAKGEDPYLNSLDEFIGCLANNDVLLNVKKAILLEPEIVFCGRKLSKDGVTFAPKGLEALINLKAPRTDAELYQLIRAPVWMRTHIPNSSEKIAPLQELLKFELTQNPSKTKK